MSGHEAAPPPSPSPRPPSGPKTPPALALSCAFGVVGVVLLLAGLISSTDAVFLAGLGAGALSLATALYWRSELVSAWAARKRSGPA